MSKHSKILFLMTLCLGFLLGIQMASASSVSELLGRGLICLPRDNHAYCSWRLLPIDDTNTKFNIYRSLAATGTFEKINTDYIINSTNYYDGDSRIVSGTDYYYKVKTVNAAGSEVEESNLFKVTAGATTNYIDVPIFENETVHHIIPGDLNGDGMLDFVVKTPNWDACNELTRTDPVTKKVTSPAPPTEIAGMIFKDGFWEKNSWHLTTDFRECDMIEDFSQNPFIAWDLDGDLKAEILTRLNQNEFAILRGETGEIITRFQRPMVVAPVNEDYDRTYAVIAHLRDMNGDGIADPFLVFQHGIFGSNQRLVAYYFNGTSVEMVNDLPVYTEPGSRQGMGGHGLPAADIDLDGKDEILPCAVAIDDDFRILWEANDANHVNVRHNDVCYPGQLIPGNESPGLEIFMGEEGSANGDGKVMMVGSDGRIKWKVNSNAADPSINADGWTDGWCSELASNNDVMECFSFEKDEQNEVDWASLTHIWEADGRDITPSLIPSYLTNKGDALRQSPVDWIKGEGVKELYRWGNPTGTANSSWYHTIWADLFGDSREEVVGFNTYMGSGAIGFFRISSNTAQNDNHRRVTPLIDRNYRAAVARAGVGYRINYIPSVSGQARTDIVFTANPPACVNFEYAPEACQPNGTQKLNIVSVLPAGCINGTPMLSQDCTHVPPRPKNEIDPVGSYIEAEDFTGTIGAVANISIESSQAYHLGSGYLKSKKVANSSLLWTEGKEYAVNFPVAGIYKIRIRSRSLNGASFAAYAGLDGVKSANTVRMVGNGDNVWQWPSWSSSGVTAINVSTAGPHKINIWAGDYDVLIDGIYLYNETQGGKPPTHVFYGKTLDLSGEVADVNSDGNVNIKDIQICIKGIIGQNSISAEQLQKCQAVAPPETVVNIKDIQAIIQEIIKS